MNIFITNNDPEICAMEHCDTHVTKQILENYQMLSTVQRHYIGDDAANERGLYKTAHFHHPCTLWVQESRENYLWLVALTKALGEVYSESRGKHHASELKLLDAISVPPVDIPSKGFTSPACAMPPKYIVLGEGSYKKAYQHYLCSKYIDWVQRADKKKIKATWWVETPHWVDKTTKTIIDHL